MKKSYKKHFGIKNRRFLWAKGLAICFFTIFAMSHNVSALTLTNNVTENYTVNKPYHRYITNDLTLGSWVNSSITRSYTGSGSDNIIGVYLRSSSNTSVTLEAGQYVEIQGWIRVVQSSVLYSEGRVLIPVGGYYGLSQNSDVNCDIKNITQNDQDYYDSSNAYVRRNITVLCLMKEDATTVYTNLYLNANLYSGATLQYNFNSFTVYDPNVSDAEKEEEAANENIEQNEEDSNSSSSDAEDASQSLISAIGGFVSSITSASASDCNIDGDMGNIDLGDIDLCSNSIPSFIPIISSLILVCLCVPFAIIMFNRFIAIFRSFQR